MSTRFARFITVGASGFAVQTAVLAALTAGARWPVVPATLLAVETAILVNYFCHERWTWRDRANTGSRVRRIWRFHLSNGLSSLVGNVALTAIGVSVFHASAIAANLMAVVMLAGFNYLAADRWIFSGRIPASGLILVLLAASPLRAAGPGSNTLSAWDQHVSAVEADLSQHESDPPLDAPRGRTIDVPGGAIHEWRGSVFVRDTTVDQLLDALLTPPDHPLQEDVAASRVLDRQGDSLRLYLKLVRKVIVTATFETEHDVTYVRRSPAFATGRSVATRIVETGGGDRGLLWRLNSYWRYRQVGSGVQVDVVSFSLSRDVPWLVRPIAGPLIERVGRESMSRTLATVERTLTTASTDAALRADQTHTR